MSFQDRLQTCGILLPQSIPERSASPPSNLDPNIRLREHCATQESWDTAVPRVFQSKAENPEHNKQLQGLHWHRLRHLSKQTVLIWSHLWIKRPLIPGRGRCEIIPKCVFTALGWKSLSLSHKYLALGPGHLSKATVRAWATLAGRLQLVTHPGHGPHGSLSAIASSLSSGGLALLCVDGNMEKLPRVSTGGFLEAPGSLTLSTPFSSTGEAGHFLRSIS